MIFIVHHSWRTGGFNPINTDEGIAHMQFIIRFLQHFNVQWIGSGKGARFWEIALLLKANIPTVHLPICVRRAYGPSHAFTWRQNPITGKWEKFAVIADNREVPISQRPRLSDRNFDGWAHLARKVEPVCEGDKAISSGSEFLECLGRKRTRSASLYIADVKKRCVRCLINEGVYTKASIKMMRAA